jgi:hypothetical protein
MDRVTPQELHAELDRVRRQAPRLWQVAVQGRQRGSDLRAQARDRDVRLQPGVRLAGATYQPAPAGVIREGEAWHR